MSRSDNDRLGDIIDAARRLAEVADYGRDEFISNWMLQDIAAIARTAEREYQFPNHP